jgi:cob(I)alamin adenosyltransferase
LEIKDNKELCEYLETIQSLLLDVGSNIATPQSTSNEARLGMKHLCMFNKAKLSHICQIPAVRTHFDEKFVSQLEQWIDHLDESLPPLRNFILPVSKCNSLERPVSRLIIYSLNRAEEKLVAACM